MSSSSYYVGHVGLWPKQLVAQLHTMQQVSHVYIPTFLAQMADAGVAAATDFDWASQMRFYWRGDDETGHLKVCVLTNIQSCVGRKSGHHKSHFNIAFALAQGRVCRAFV